MNDPLLIAENTWALWPDGTMCEIAEVGQYTHLSDDYERVVVLEYDEHGQPVQWRALTP